MALFRLTNVAQTMTDRQNPGILQTDLEEVLALYYGRRVDLEGLCKLAATYGVTRAEANPPSIKQLAGQLSLFVHDRATIQVSQTDAQSLLEAVMKKKSGEKSSPLKTGHSPIASPAEDYEPQTIVAPTNVRVRRDTMEVKAADTALALYCQKRHVVAKLEPRRAPDAPELDALGDSKYAIGVELGVGGVGRVNVATDRDLRRDVAIKRLQADALMDPLQLQAFIEEAIVTGGLEHPNIVPIYDLGHSEELGPHYVMKRLTGLPLSRILRNLRASEQKTEERFGLFKLLGCFVEICQGITFAHDHGVLHCDLKPSNIIVGEYGETTIVDWGLARVLGDRGKGQARALLTSGTPSYMPPEQATGTARDLTKQTDVWSLGAILYEMLTLTVPFAAETTEETLLKLLADPVVPPSQRAPKRSIPQELERICMQALEKDVLLRYASVAELLNDIEGYLVGTRERRRQEEIVGRALEEVEALLSRFAEAEAQADALQAQLVSGVGDAYELELELAAARDDLVYCYSDAYSALKRGYDSQSDSARLHTAVGDLYWRIFTRLYPGKVPPEPQVREHGVELLSHLAKLSLSAIVQTGKKYGHAATGRPQTHTSADPWLDAVLAFCGDLINIDPSRAPNAMEPLVRRIAFLKAVPLFAKIPGSDLLPIAESCHQLDYPAGTPIFRMGDAGDALYVVMSGSVHIVREHAVLNTLHQTDCFGEIAVLDQAPRTAGAVAAEAVSCLVLTAESFRSIVRDNGEIGLAVVQVLTDRLRRATEREATLRSEVY